MRVSHVSGAGRGAPASERVGGLRRATPPGPTKFSAHRSYLDVMRGVAVLIMIEAHLIDSWTRAADHQSHWFRQSMVLGGFAAPLFLFFAGVAVAMSAGSEGRRAGGG